MSLADPITPFTIGATSHSLNRLPQTQLGTVSYANADGTVRLDILQQPSTGKSRTRYSLKLTLKKYYDVDDPDKFDQLVLNRSADRPTAQIFTETDVKDLEAGFNAFLSATNVAKLFQGQA